MIRRPFTPPRAFTYLKYASAPRATEAYAEATPESGVVPPIRIEFPVTPGSAVSRPLAAGNATANAAAKTPIRMDVLRIPVRRRCYDRFVSGKESLERKLAAPRGSRNMTTIRTTP